MRLPMTLPSSVYPPVGFVSFFTDEEKGLSPEDQANAILSVSHVVSYYAIQEWSKGNTKVSAFIGNISPAVEGEETPVVLFPVADLASRKEMHDILNYIKNSVLQTELCLFDEEVFPNGSAPPRVQSFVQESGAKFKVFFFGIKDEVNKKNILGGIALDIDSALGKEDPWKDFLKGGGISYIFEITEELSLPSSVIFDQYLQSFLKDIDENPILSLPDEDSTSQEAIIPDEWTPS